MADTHINAFFADVAEAEKKVAAATGELQAAQARLETKKKEVGYVEDTLTKVEDTSPQPAPAKTEEVKPTRFSKQR